MTSHNQKSGLFGRTRARAQIYCELLGVALRPEDKIKSLSHLPMSIRESLIHLISLNKINRRLRDKFYRDRLVIVAGLSKGGSSSIATCIQVIQKHQFANGEAQGLNTTLGKRKYAKYMLPNQDSNIRPELVLDLIDGGVLKYHTKATPTNLRALETLQAKYVISCRHPADQLVGFYCQRRKPDPETHGKRWGYSQIAPFKPEVFRPGHDIDETIAYLITCGYMWNAMTWITEWLTYRDPDRSMVVRFEDLMNNSDQILPALAKFVTEGELQPNARADLQAVLNPSDVQQKIRDSERYPRGYSGKVDIWKDYFSDRNRELYNTTVRSFVSSFPGGEALSDLYRDLLLDQ